MIKFAYLAFMVAVSVATSLAIVHKNLRAEKFTEIAFIILSITVALYTLNTTRK